MTVADMVAQILLCIEVNSFHIKVVIAGDNIKAGLASFLRIRLGRQDQGFPEANDRCRLLLYNMRIGGSRIPI